MLTDPAIRSLLRQAALYRVADRGGLCLEVNPGAFVDVRMLRDAL